MHIRTYSGGKRKRKDACRYTNKLNYDKLFPTSQRNDPSKLLQLKINKRMLCDFSESCMTRSRPIPSSRQDAVTVHFRTPSDCNTVYTFHTKTVSHPTNSTLLCLCDKAIPHNSWLSKPRSAIMKHESDAAACLRKILRLC